MSVYYRAIAQTDSTRPKGALPIAGGWSWFDRVEKILRDNNNEIVSLSEVPEEVLEAISSPRAPMAGLDFTSPRIMGILNVTPDSFSDGGQFNSDGAAMSQVQAMLSGGADMIDIGGESTRPGAKTVVEDEEIQRTVPVIKALRGISEVPVSIDTRKAAVAAAALNAGADLVNDVAAMTYDPEIAEVTAKSGAPICLMHAQGNPEVMQKDPRYSNALLDVYDFLQSRMSVAVSKGIPKERIMLDPGIGFGKTLEHNLELLKGLSLFHSLGCPILLGVSRKRFIGELGNAPEAQDRMPGSVAVAMAGVSQGVQVLRVHDVPETRQALSLHMALIS